VEPESLTPAGRRWVERVQRPLDVLAVIFLIDVILIWSFPDGPPGFRQTLNGIVLVVWTCFAVDYVARLLLSVQKGRFVRTHKLDLLMVLLPMLRLLRVVLLLRRSLASVSTERIAGSIVSLVVVAVFVSAFFMWRVEHNAPGATITTFRNAIWWAIETTTTVGYGAQLRTRAATAKELSLTAARSVGEHRALGAADDVPDRVRIPLTRAGLRPVGACPRFAAGRAAFDRCRDGAKSGVPGQLFFSSWANITMMPLGPRT
jgi:hypothetical protein